jgi:hypothetical protein
MVHMQAEWLDPQTAFSTCGHDFQNRILQRSRLGAKFCLQHARR